MISISNVECPLCGQINVIKIKETQGPLSFQCEKCNEVSKGHANLHGGPGVLCTYGDVPGFGIQKRE